MSKGNFGCCCRAFARCGMAWDQHLHGLMMDGRTVRGWHSDGPREVRDLNRFACHPFLLLRAASIARLGKHGHCRTKRESERLTHPRVITRALGQGDTRRIRVGCQVAYCSCHPPPPQQAQKKDQALGGEGMGEKQD